VGDDLQAEPARLDVVEHQVAGDRGEPRADVPALVTDRGDPPQRPEERLTGDVLREVAVTHSEEDIAVDAVDVAVVETAERAAVAALGGPDQIPALGCRIGLRRLGIGYDSEWNACWTSSNSDWQAHRVAPPPGPFPDVSVIGVITATTSVREHTRCYRPVGSGVGVVIRQTPANP